MQRLWRNLFLSKQRLMVALRYLLFLAVLFMGVERLRIVLSTLQGREFYNNKDVLQYFLIIKAISSGVNPYLPLSELAQLFYGGAPYFPHPAPCTPFLATLIAPLAGFDLDQLTLIWFVGELVLLVLLACLIPLLWKNKADWKASLIFLVCLFAWDAVANDLSYGQLSILLTFCLLAGLLALRKNRSTLAGVLVGLTVAIKLITWPLIILFALKKDWRALISSCLTALVLNLIALVKIGIGPFIDYYLHVSTQVTTIYQSVINNLSLWSIGFRFFVGAGTKYMDNFISAPPIAYIPQIAPYVSALIIIIFLIGGFLWASKSIAIDKAYAIIICLILLVSPLSWEHYYIILIIPLAILVKSLVKNSFPARQTLVFVILGLLLFLFNGQINNIVILLNGGLPVVAANGNRISFVSSLLSYLPATEVIALAILLRLSEREPDIGVAPASREQIPNESLSSTNQ